MNNFIKNPLKQAIIFDIDDVIFDTRGAIKLFFNNIMKKNIKNSDFYYLTDIEKENFKKNESYIYSLCKILPNTNETIIELKNIGYHIILLTARNLNFKHITKYTLENNNVVYDDIYFYKDKSTIIELLNKVYDIKAFVDDYIKNLENISINTELFCYNWYRSLPCNYISKHKNIKFIMNLKELLEGIK